MNLINASSLILDQLRDVLEQIREKDYSLNVVSLEASIGQHVRHIIEFYQCLFEGMDKGVINYDQRKRDARIEEDKFYAMEQIATLQALIGRETRDPELMLEIRYGEISDDVLVLRTNYQRELAYNIEHTVHHLAIIKTAFKDICEYIELPDSFGIASSTMRYRNDN